MDFLTYNEIRKVKKDTVDAVQTEIDGVAALIPTQTGKANLALKTDGTKTYWGSVAPLLDDSKNIVASLVTASNRGNNYSNGNWSSSAAWTTYYNDLSDVNSITQAWNMAMGDGYPNGSSQKFYSNDMAGMEKHIETAFGNRMGHFGKNWTPYLDQNNNSYSGTTWRLIPIRNTTSAAITRTMSLYASAYSGNGSYTGCGVALYTPNSSKYSNVSSGSWSRLTGSTSSSQTAVTSVSVTVPANTTVILMIASSHAYQTSYRFEDTNLVYNISSFFDGNLVCDLRMLNTLMYGRVDSIDYSTSSPNKHYNLCATLYGDR